MSETSTAPKPASIVNEQPTTSGSPETRTNRRDFLKRSLGAVGAAAITAILGRPETAEAQKKSSGKDKKPLEPAEYVEIIVPGNTVPGYEPRHAEQHTSSKPIPTRKEDYPEAKVPENIKEILESQTKAANYLMNPYPNNTASPIGIIYDDSTQTNIHAIYRDSSYQKMKLIVEPQLKVSYMPSDPLPEKVIKLKTGKELGRLIIKSYDQYLIEEFVNVIGKEFGVDGRNVLLGKITAEKMAEIAAVLDPLLTLENYTDGNTRESLVEPKSWEDRLSTLYALWTNEPDLVQKLKSLGLNSNDKAVNILLGGLGVFNRVLPVGTSLKAVGLDEAKIGSIKKMSSDPQYKAQ